MCLGGGNSASKQAAAQAAQQTNEINQNVSAINSAFANRQGQYDDYLGALRKSYGTELAKQTASAGRNLKFANARGGLTGGSESAQLGGELQQEEARGAMTAEQTAQAKLAGLKSQDEATRLQLISMAQAGGNIGNAAQEASTALQANIQNAESGLAPTTLGDVFGGLTSNLNTMNQAYQQRLGLRAAQSYLNAFSNSANTNTGFGGPSK